MTKDDQYAIEVHINAIVEDAGLMSALEAVANDERRSAEEAVFLAVKEGNLAKSQLLVGRKDGIDFFMGALKKIAREYRSRATRGT